MVDEGVWSRAPERLALANAYHEVAAVIGWDAAIDFGLAVWEMKRPPSRRKAGCWDRQGMIYIPATIKKDSGRELVAMVGLQDALLLAEAFGGTQLEFPNITAASIQRRNKAIAEQVADGWFLNHVAATFGLTGRQVRRICRDQGGCPVAALPAARALRRWRRASAVSEVRGGSAIEDAAREYGFTIDAIRESVSNVQ